MSSPLSRKKKARNTCAQKKVRFEEQLREIGVMSNEHIGKKTSIGEPSGPWSKKSKIEESARSQEVMLDKIHISQSYTFLEYFLMLGDATRDHPCDNSLYDYRENGFHHLVTFGMDSRMNPFKERGYGMTENEHENVEIFQGPENKGKVALFEKMIQDLDWHVVERQKEELRGSKTLLLSMVQVKEPKETSVEELEASNS
ncbi:hypothetical protein M9H77_03436 [Catharanthus roseus]|uniref:Uncharacterized protein n=1 Tax=Catharanthus roseus TaxID=4058 RepID=A0ACC0CB53_CATRO|nr:hypothetical protein M9H77_03436 [Catharanthus roseus]